MGEREREREREREKERKRERERERRLIIAPVFRVRACWCVSVARVSCASLNEGEQSAEVCM